MKNNWLIKNITVWTMNQGIIENCDILIQEGKIVQVQPDIQNLDCELIDGKGLNALPGLVDAHSHIGTMSIKNDTQDSNEMTNPVTPEVSIINGFDPESSDVKAALQNGITSVGLAPGSGNVVGGEVIAIKTSGTNAFDMVMKRPIALKCATGFNPKNQYGSKGERPLTRMAIAQILVELLTKGQEYAKAKAQNVNDPTKKPVFDAGLELVEKVLKREIPLKVHSGGNDMLTVVDIAKRFNVQFTLDHATGSARFADEIAAAKPFGVIGGPYGGPAHFVGEGKGNTILDMIELNKRGVLTAVMTDGPILRPSGLIHEIGSAVRLGMDVYEALKMITINPAKIIMCEDRIGSLSAGKDADIVIFKGIPALETNATVQYTIVNGTIVFQREKG
jgi:imidazolonepropionase-like amidohydrolase